MSAVLDKVHQVRGLSESFARAGLSNVRVFALPPIPDYAPTGGLGFLVEAAGTVSAIDVIRLEEELQGQLGVDVLIMTARDKSYYIPDEVLQSAAAL